MFGPLEEAEDFHMSLLVPTGRQFYWLRAQILVSRKPRLGPWTCHWSLLSLPQFLPSIKEKQKWHLPELEGFSEEMQELYIALFK